MAIKYIGQHIFGRHYSQWGIWRADSLNSATLVKDVATYEEALTETYRLNGWGEPKKLRRVS